MIVINSVYFFYLFLAAKETYDAANEQLQVKDKNLKGMLKNYKLHFERTEKLKKEADDLVDLHQGRAFNGKIIHDTSWCEINTLWCFFFPIFPFSEISPLKGAPIEDIVQPYMPKGRFMISN